MNDIFFTILQLTPSGYWKLLYNNWANGLL